MDRPDRTEPADVLTRQLLSVEEYRAEVLSQLDVLTPSPRRTRRVAVGDAAGHYLAEDVEAALNVPHFANSSMDGFAAHSADLSTLPARLRVAGHVAAGARGVEPFASGECVRVMTGGPVGQGADVVVPLEMTRPTDDAHVIEVLEAPPAGAFIRRVGSALPAGTVVAHRGKRVSAGLIASLVAAGVGHVSVVEPPRVAVLSTGDELISPGLTPEFGQVPDVNTGYLSHLAAAYGASVTSLPPVADRTAAFTDAVTAAVQSHDIVVVSGGASVGDHDVARIVLGAQEYSAFRHVRMQPGKPQGWSRFGAALVLSLPGNPLSATASFIMFVAPLIAHLAGGSAPDADGRAVLSQDQTSPAGRRQFLPVRLSFTTDGRVMAEAVHAHGSASHLTTVLAEADALLIIPEDVTTVAAGDVFDFVRLK